MNAKNMNRSLALVAVILSVFMLLTLTVLPTFAEDATAEAATEAVTEAATGEASTEAATDATTGEATTGEDGTGADTVATTGATTEAATKGETTTEAETEDEEAKKIARTTGIINLIVGGVLVIAVIALAFVFRKKIPGWFKALKSECGKIVWCPKDKLKKNTFVVLVTIVVLAVVIGLLDFGFSRGIMLLRDIFKG